MRSTGARTLKRESAQHIAFWLSSLAVPEKTEMSLKCRKPHLFRQDQIFRTEKQKRTQYHASTAS